ncbi:hypothetical protein J6590_060958 [Homalodisca vitripennis]|nr:hypothetical protein J6590_060958 [Homalodisca vitripennis]
MRWRGLYLLGRCTFSELTLTIALAPPTPAQPLAAFCRHTGASSAASSRQVPPFIPGHIPRSAVGDLLRLSRPHPHSPTAPTYRYRSKASDSRPELDVAQVQILYLSIVRIRSTMPPGSDSVGFVSNTWREWSCTHGSYNRLRVNYLVVLEFGLRIDTIRHPEISPSCHEYLAKTIASYI